MPDFKPITRARHEALRWNRPPNLGFAADQAVAPIVLNELAQASLSLPVAFLLNGEDWLVVAVLGVPPTTNLCLTPEGRWLPAYVPASLRTYPFALVRAPGDQSLLCFDEGSGLVREGAVGERFFEDDGQPAALISEVFKFLTQWEQNRAMTQRATAALHRHGLIQPWPVTVNTPAGEHTFGGLSRINEPALNQLPAEGLHELMQCGALALAYGQLLSMQNFNKMGKALAPASPPAVVSAADGMASSPALAETPVQKSTQSVIPPSLINPSGDLDLGFLAKGDTLQFGKPR